MSYPPSSSVPNNVVPSQSDRYVVQPNAIQSAITTHQNKSAKLNKVLRGSEITQLRIEWAAAYEALVNGQLSSAEYTAEQRRIMDADDAFGRRTAEFGARMDAGQVRPGDFFKEFYGCTDEEAEERLRHDRNMDNMQRANETHNRDRIFQSNRHGRGH